MNKVLWAPNSSNLKKSKMALFMNYVNQEYSLSISDYSDLHRWSISRSGDFWESVSDFFKIYYDTKFSKIVENESDMFETKWFVGAKLNYAENMLKHRNLDSNAIEFYNELGQYRSLTFNDITNQVSALNNLFLEIGLNKGDRVAAVMPNTPETIIASLASSSVGAVWSSTSPDFGTQAILDRFEQIDPSVLVLCDGYTFKGKTYSCYDKIEHLILNLKSVRKVIIFDYINLDRINHPKCIYWDEINFSKSDNELKFISTSFDDPLYIMFSSGTTGKPKSIVHSVGGTLIQHIKELGLHTDLQSDEKILYYTTCGWMMWNWMLSSLFFGSTIVLYEGSPFYPNKNKLLDVIDNANINVFGTSAKYISHIQSENICPKNKYKFKELRAILSTGSTLTHENFDYVYSEIKKNVQLSSISGGTDIISCFALGNPLLEVRRGELQCIGLGMAVSSFNEKGDEVKNEKGELVCKQPFPSMPIYFWGDKNRKKYYNSYFNKHDNIWTHGDFIQINDSNGVVIFGRSDATLNPGGIRIGTAEIYSAIESISYLEDSIAVSSNLKDAYILFVKLSNDICLDGNLIKEIKLNIKNNLSPKHLPSDIIQVQDIPYTLNGKKVEIAVKNIIDRKNIENIDSISNPECLDEYYKKTI